MPSEAYLHPSLNNYAKSLDRSLSSDIADLPADFFSFGSIPSGITHSNSVQIHLFHSCQTSSTSKIIVRYIFFHRAHWWQVPRPTPLQTLEATPRARPVFAVISTRQSSGKRNGSVWAVWKELPQVERSLRIWSNKNWKVMLCINCVNARYPAHFIIRHSDNHISPLAVCIVPCNTTSITNRVFYETTCKKEHWGWDCTTFEPLETRQCIWHSTMV